MISLGGWLVVVVGKVEKMAAVCGGGGKGLLKIFQLFVSCVLSSDPHSFS